MAELSIFSVANITNSLGNQGQSKFRVRKLIFTKHNTIEDEVEKEMSARAGSNWQSIKQL